MHALHDSVTAPAAPITEAALRESEALLRDVQEIAGVGSWRYDFQTGVTTWSDELHRIQGLAPGAVPPSLETFLAAVHRDDRERVEADIREAVETGRAYAHDYRFVRPDGTIRTHHCRGRAMLGADGAATCVIGSCQDITERTHTADALRASEERLRLALRAAGMIVWELDLASGALRTTVSREGAPLVDPRDPMEGARAYAAFLGVLHPEDRPRVEAAAALALAEGSDVQADFRIVRPDGAVRWRHVLGRVVLAADGSPERMVGVGLDLTDRKALEEELARRAHHDVLTGLANRALFLARVAATLAASSSPADGSPADGSPADGSPADGSPAVLLVDLDDFKRVNDSMGHEAGDRLLQSVTTRLLDATRGSDMVARLGGDEFAILLGSVPTSREAVRVADRVIAALSAPHRLAGRQVQVGASLGIALAEREDDPDALIRNADLALHRAKALGKNRHATFARAMHAAAVERLQLETELRRAIEAGELMLQFQPIVALDTGAAVGAEALVRWRHPERGVISPAAFVPLAESTGLIVPLGRWVLEEACRAACGWEDTPGTDAPPLSIAVNVSARQLQHHGFLEDVASALRHSGLAPGRLVLEVTESVLLEDLEPALGRLEALRALGVRLALDDFGTGYSSLAYLQRLPVDVLKIDRTFTTDLMAGGRRAAVARAVVTFARTLGLRTVAEGIETPEQRAEVLALGCTLGQGFHFARALDLDDATAYLRAHRARACASGPVKRDAAPVDDGGTPDGDAVSSVLVVDDEPAVRRFARMVLEGAGHRVLEASDGAEAVRRLAVHSGRIDLVLTDVEMPELSGPALAGALTTWAPGTRVLFMSGAGSDALVPFATGMPQEALLTKPFTPEELRAAVESTLAAAR
ncbi:MAG: EAL domain-containing protein [Gemmatirosa sp.]